MANAKLESNKLSSGLNFLLQLFILVAEHDEEYKCNILSRTPFDMCKQKILPSGELIMYAVSWNLEKKK